VFYFPAVLLLIPNISSSVNWGVPHGLHKIAPVSLSLTASIYRAHKLAYVPSLLFYTPCLQLRYGTDIWLAQNMVGNAEVTICVCHQQCSDEIVPDKSTSTTLRNTPLTHIFTRFSWFAFNNRESAESCLCASEGLRKVVFSNFMIFFLKNFFM
jgi:hypothetical protein